MYPNIKLLIMMIIWKDCIYIFFVYYLWMRYNKTKGCDWNFNNFILINIYEECTSVLNRSEIKYDNLKGSLKINFFEFKLIHF